MRRTFMLLAITSILAGLFLACGAEDACQLPQQEAPYPASGVHLLDETGATWAGDPPTSGPTGHFDRVEGSTVSRSPGLTRWRFWRQAG